MGLHEYSDDNVNIVAYFTVQKNLIFKSTLSQCRNIHKYACQCTAVGIKLNKTQVWRW